MEFDKIHVRHLMLFCCRKGKNAAKTIKEIRSVYGKESLERVLAGFKNSNFDLNDLP